MPICAVHYVKPKASKSLRKAFAPSAKAGAIITGSAVAAAQSSGGMSRLPNAKPLFRLDLINAVSLIRPRRARSARLAQDEDSYETPRAKRCAPARRWRFK